MPSTSSRDHLPGWQDMVTLLLFSFASFCIRLIASVKAVRLDAASTRCFKMPAHPAQGIMGEPRDMGVLQPDPRPEPGTREIPTSMGEPGGSLSSR